MQPTRLVDHIDRPARHLFWSCLAALALSGRAPAQEAAPDVQPEGRPAPTAEAPVEASPEPPAEPSGAAPSLGPDEVARVRDVSITRSQYLAYVGTVYARLELGQAALQQVLSEQLVQAAADASGISVDDEQVAELAARLDAQALETDGQDPGLAAGLESGLQVIRTSLTLLALQQRVVAQELGLPDGQQPDNQQLTDWLTAATEAAGVQPEPLTSGLAARWPGGELSREELGRRIERLLEPAERSGVLTELLGILLIRERAAQLGVEFTAEAAAQELLQRDRQVQDRGSQGLRYVDIVQEVQKLSAEELVASPRFGAEVLLQLMVDRNWSEERLKAYYERERASFAERYGEEASYEELRPLIARQVRQHSYQLLLAESTIARRF
jgi:hypothetical protein